MHNKFTYVECVGWGGTDVEALDECTNASHMTLLRQCRLEVAHSTALAPARRLQMEWRNNTIPLLSSQKDTMARKKKTVQPWKCKSIWVLALNIQSYGLRSYRWYFNSFKLCRSLCIEVHLNGICIMCVEALVCSMGAMPAKFVIDRHASRQANWKGKEMT